MNKETLLDLDQFKKEHGDVTVRSIGTDNHVLCVVYWGKDNKNYKLQAILHPNGEKKPCKFLDDIKASGKLNRLLEKGGKSKESYQKYNPYKIQINQMPCPTCGMMNTISRSSVYIRCDGCGRKLVNVKVRQRR